MLTIIRILFWTFILVQVGLLLFSDKVHRRLNATFLHWATVTKMGIVLAYFIYTFPKISFYSDWFFHIIGLIILLVLLLLVWRAYLPKSLDKEKLYELKNLAVRPMQPGAQERVVFGEITEGKYFFTACLYLAEEDFVRLHAQGFFDDRSSKSLSVKLTDLLPKSQESVDLVVRLA